MPIYRPRMARRGRTLLAVVVFLSVFGMLLALVSHYYLIPAFKVQGTASPEIRRLLGASSRLIMALLLLALLMGLLLTFPIGRLFFPRRRDSAKPTQYVDAWKEAGRRMKVPPAEDEEGDPPPE